MEERAHAGSSSHIGNSKGLGKSLVALLDLATIVAWPDAILRIIIAPAPHATNSARGSTASALDGHHLFANYVGARLSRMAECLAQVITGLPLSATDLAAGAEGAVIGIAGVRGSVSLARTVVAESLTGVNPTRQSFGAGPTARDVLQIAGDILADFVAPHAGLRDKHHTGGTLFVVVAVMEHRMIAGVLTVAGMRAVRELIVSARNWRIADRFATTTAKRSVGSHVARGATSFVAKKLALMDSAGHALTTGEAANVSSFGVVDISKSAAALVAATMASAIAQGVANAVAGDWLALLSWGKIDGRTDALRLRTAATTSNVDLRLTRGALSMMALGLAKMKTTCEHFAANRTAEGNGIQAALARFAEKACCVLLSARAFGHNRSIGLAGLAGTRVAQLLALVVAAGQNPIAGLLA